MQEFIKKVDYIFCHNFSKCVKEGPKCKQRCFYYAMIEDIKDIKEVKEKLEKEEEKK